MTFLFFTVLRDLKRNVVALILKRWPIFFLLNALRSKHYAVRTTIDRRMGFRASGKVY